MRTFLYGFCAGDIRVISLELVLRDHRNDVAHGLALSGRWLDDIVVDGEVDRDKLALHVARFAEPVRVEQLASGMEEALRASS